MRYTRHLGRLTAIGLCLLLGSVVIAYAQGSPVSAQIQRALASFLRAAHTWTGTQTFADLTVGGTCTGCGTGGAPADATYITKTANGTLSAEQALSTLSTGLMKVTTATGAITTAVAGTDYVAPGAGANLVLSATLFTALGTPANGTMIYCSDCTIANPCAGSGTGAFAKRLNGVWVCN